MPVEAKKWEKNPAKSFEKSLWPEPGPSDPNEHSLPPGMTEKLVLVDTLPRFVIEILEPCGMAGIHVKPGERYEVYEEEMQVMCGGGSITFDGVPLVPAKARLIERIEPTPGARVRKINRNPNEIEAPERPDGPRVRKL
jgi:hypothetical protein